MKGEPIEDLLRAVEATKRLVADLALERDELRAWKAKAEPFIACALQVVKETQITGRVPSRRAARQLQIASSAYRSDDPPPAPIGRTSCPECGASPLVLHENGCVACGRPIT